MKPLSPEEAKDYIARVMRARELLGSETLGPSPDMAERVVRRGAEVGMKVSFQRILDDETSAIVWELRVKVARGVLIYTPEHGESWDAVLDRAGLSYRRRRDGT